MKKLRKQVVLHLFRSDLEIAYKTCKAINIRRDRFTFDARQAICDCHVALFVDDDGKKYLIK